jgi:hypothetical protein
VKTFVESLTPVGKTIVAIAAACATLAGIFQGGAWLVGTAFVSKEAFAAHESKDGNRETQTDKQFSQIKQYMILDCGFKANGNPDKMAMCHRVLIEEK